MTYYDISTSIQRSCKTYGKLRLQLAAPPLHGRDRHIEGNHLPGQGLLQMEVMFGSQGHTLDLRCEYICCIQPDIGAFGVGGLQESSDVQVEELVPRKPALPYFRP